MNSSEIEVELTKRDNEILSQMEILDTLLIEKHNSEVKLMQLSETIRQSKKLLSGMKIKKEILSRDLWIALRKEKGQF